MLVVRASVAERVRADLVAELVIGGALRDGRSIARAPIPAADEPASTALGAAILRAEEQFARLSFEEARLTLDEARHELDARGPGAATRSELVELFLLRARVADALGDEPASSESLGDALAIEPDLVVDLARHPPALAARVEAMRAALRRCVVTLVLDPAGADVAIDGGPAGTIPSELGCGSHWATVTAPGHLPRSVAFSAEDAPRRVSVGLELDLGAAFATVGAPGEPPSTLALRAAETMGRELILLDISVDDGLHVRLGDVRVDAPLHATPDEIVALLRAAARPIEGPDPGIVAGVSIGAALAVALAVTVAVLATMPGPPTGFELRGHVLP